MAGDKVAQSGTKSGAIGTYIPDAEHRRSFISLRWLVIILASYLTLFTHLSSPRFPVFFVFAAVFAATNITLAFVPTVWFESASAQAAIASCDVLFVCGTIYLLQVPNTYLYLEFMLIFLLAAVWRDLRLVLFSLLMVSVLLGVFIYFRIAGFVWSVSIEQFLTPSLFFVVSIFYVFLSRQLRNDAVLSRMILEEKRNAEVIVEVMRRLSSSLKTQEVLSMVVNRLCELLNAGECSIITIDSKTGEAKVVVRSFEPDLRYPAVDWLSEPEMKEAFETRKIAIATNPQRSVIAVPMISQDTVLGVIH